MNVWVVAGGTGGHFYPGLAVAKEFLAHGDNVRFLVRKNDFVLPLLTRENIPFTEISAAGFRRSLHPLNLLAPLKLGWGFLESFCAVAKYRPDVMVVMGGYLSVPPAISAAIFRIPLLLHEQNVLPGLANRLLSVLAKKVAVSFSDSQTVFGSKAMMTGNPLRPEFKTLPSQTEALKTFHLEQGKKTILVFGGSLGARVLNKAVIEVLKAHPDWAGTLQLLHFSGKQEETNVLEAYKNLPFKYFSSGYCHDMASAYAAADFVISRSGASTVTELMVVRKPSFLVPYPFATGDHQMKNAEMLSRVGAAQICREGSSLVETLTKAIDGVRKGTTTYKKVDMYPLDAASKIRELALSLV